MSSKQEKKKFVILVFGLKSIGQLNSSARWIQRLESCKEALKNFLQPANGFVSFSLESEFFNQLIIGTCFAIFYNF